ncbi:MAG: hypothetical protein IJ520_09870, partial [Synergistaceae bacterium]|nr:hypothetical protein [Synergistaceae bacterium]
TNNLLGDVINANAPTLADPQAGYNFSNLNNAYQQAGYNNLNYGTPAVNNGLTLNKIMQALANDPTRFRSVNMADMAKLAEPYVAEAHALRDKTKLENLANTVYQDGKFNPEQAAILAMRGFIKPDVLRELTSQNMITPYQQAELDYRNAKLAQDARQFDANLRYNYYNTDTGNAFKYANLNQDAEQFGVTHELNKQNADTNETAIIVTKDGETYRVNKRTGEATSVKDPETGKPLKSESKYKPREMSNYESEDLKEIHKRQGNLRSEIANLKEQYEFAEDKDNKERLKAELQQKQAELWREDFAENSYALRYDGNNPLAIQRYKELLTEAQENGYEIPYMGGKQTQEQQQAQQQAQANAQNTIKVKGNGDVEQATQPTISPDPVVAAQRGADYAKQYAQNINSPTISPDPVVVALRGADYAKQYAQNINPTAKVVSNSPASADVTPKNNGTITVKASGDVINSTNSRPTVQTDVAGGNPNGTTSSVNNNSAAKVTPPDDLIYDPINNRGKKA